MKKTIIPGIAAAILLLGGCGGSSSNPQETGESTTAQSGSSTPAQRSLETLARESQDAQSFARAALETLRPQVIGQYVPEAYRARALQSQALSVDSLMQDQQINAALVRYYDEANAPQATDARALESGDLSGMLDAIYNAIRGFVIAWLDDLFGLGGDESNQTQSTDETSASFTYGLLGGQTFYVVSSKTNMTVEVNEDGRGGSGSVGFFSTDFTNVIEPDGTLTLSTELMGKWNLRMEYFDPGYCIAADAVDEDGAHYPSYWFYNESDRETVDTLDEAKALCFIHAQVLDSGPEDGKGTPY